VAATALLAGCGTENDPAADAGPSTGGAFPVSIEHAFGTTTIDARPERVVTLGWSAQDVVYALGVTPVGMPSYSFGGGDDGVLPWDEKHVDAKRTTLLDTTDGPPLEKIAALRPDVILAPYDGFDRATYDDLSRIAPTVAYTDKAWSTPWTQQTELIGKALGRSAQAAKLITDTQDSIAAVKAQHPEFDGRTFAYTSMGADSLYLYLPSDPRVQLIQDLGLTVAPSVATLANGATTFYAQLSPERAPDIDADVVVGFADGMTASEVTSSPVYSRVPAVGRGSAVVIDDDTFAAAVSSVSVLSIPYALDQLVDRLSTAAKAAAGA
jgi:iron complex transport system substrate-binding protein